MHETGTPLQSARIPADMSWMSERARQDQARSGCAPRTGGLGAITVILFTVLAYTTAAGVLVAVDGLWRGVHGDVAAAPLIVAIVLLAPVTLIGAHLGRRRSRRTV